MPSVTIDTGILAVPPLTATADQAYEYVELLVDWSRLLDEPWVAIYMSERASDVLNEEHLYPLRNALRPLFSARGIVEYDVNTVATLAERLLKMAPGFETFFRVRDVLLDDDGGLVTEPDLLAIHTAPGLVSELGRCVVLIAILRNHCCPPMLDHTLIIKPCPGATTVHVRALVHDPDHSRDDIAELPKPPQYLEGTILVCRNFKELVSCIDEAAVWQTAQDDAGLRLAVQIALYKSRLRDGREPEWEDVPPFSLGRQFVHTVREHCRDNPAALIARILRAMVETLDGLNLADVHALRTGVGGGNPPRKRGEDRAQRRDIDRQYHLHYWQCENRSIEFGSVVIHDDCSIPY
jgi:hypothetical protein